MSVLTWLDEFFGPAIVKYLGVELAQRPLLIVEGDGVTATDDGAAITLTIPGGDATMGGDCSGTTAACVVEKVNGITCSGTPAAGNVLRATSTSAAAWGACDLADSDAVTGVLPTANQAAQAMGGDCSGTTAACVVAKVNGITCTGTPAAGAVLRATSSSAAAWGAVDLADTDAVTGVLATANQAAQALGGDCSGTTAAAVVGKINGITCAGVPAAGAVLRATSSSAAAWGTLDLADSDARTGVLPRANGGNGHAGGTTAMAALDVDWSLSDAFTKTLSLGVNTITFSNKTAGQVIVVRLTGAVSTVTWPTVKWPGGVAPTQTSSGIDVYTFFYDGTSVYGSAVQAMA